MAAFVDRVIGAAKLNVPTYEEVERDSNATGQAMGVVLLSSAAQAVGSSGYGATGLIWGMISALSGWIIWSFLSYIIGTRLLPEPQTRSNLGELLRTTGFASAPGILRIFAFVPIIGWFISLLVLFWMLAAMVIAVRQALDYESTGRAVAVCLIGFAVNLIALIVLSFFWIS
jgi:hypothetical protein